MNLCFIVCQFRNRTISNLHMSQIKLTLLFAMKRFPLKVMFIAHQLDHASVRVPPVHAA